MNPKIKFLIKRLAYSVLVLLVASMVAFFILRLIPGDPARIMLGDSASPEQLAEYRSSMGLDKPILVQYGMFIGRVLRGDFGVSTYYNKSCIDLISSRMPATIQLTCFATLVSLVTSIPIGLLASKKKGGFFDIFGMFIAVMGNALSPVWLGVLLILVFGVTLKVLPVQGYGSFANIILPGVTLGMSMTAAVVRQLRSSMFDILSEDYITATYVRGLKKFTVFTKFALKNAMLPVITIIGLNIANMLAGSVITESVFGWPGIGNLMMKSVSLRDYPLVQAILLISSSLFVLVNLAVDIVYTLVDPRMKLG